ncbi:hypothetical protein C8R46DRAFT_480152 [Mycena filopes]|nr:hypothetical protein C8R46DRAFT_480152 [Mycena filopes]
MPYRPLSASECEAIRTAQRNNTHPGPAEVAAIREALAEAQSQLDAEQHDAVQAAELRRDIAYLASQVAPMRRLPSNILAAIFLEPPFGGRVYRRSLAIVGRMTDPIAAVSHRWRSTALSTPQFWSTFSVSLSATTDILEPLLLYLERSHNYPLYLKIWMKHSAQPNEVILTHLLSTSERWSSLQLEIETQYLPLFDPVRGRLPLLEHLTLSGSTRIDMSVGTANLKKTDGFELAPRLTRLDFRIFLDLVPALPLHQLKLLSTSHSSVALANRCPNLTTLICTENVRDTGPPVITNATTLHLYAGLIQSHEITAPKATHLRLVGVGSPWSQAHFALFAQRSQCATTLHTLVLDDILIRGNDVVALLPLIPAVRSLSMCALRPNALTDKVIHALTPTDDLLPKLTALTVEGSYLFGTAALLTMLEARTPALRAVALHLKHRELEEEDRRRLRTLTDGRMVLSVKCLNAEKEYVTVI